MKIILPLAFLFMVALGCAPRDYTREPYSPPQTEAPPKKLAADVEMTQTGIKITNTDSVDFPSLSMKLNLRDAGGDDGRAEAGALAKGKSVTIPYRDFTAGTTRFDRNKTAILTIYVKSGDGSAKLFLCPGRKCVPR
jgi:hypothetical protein